MKSFAIKLVVFVAVFAVALYLLSWRSTPSLITYGVSFNKLYADELGLEWHSVYRALLDELEVKHLRLSAHWPMIEPERDQYSWSEMDFQINEAKKRDAKVIVAIGRRLPRWPECHVPHWVGYMPWEEQKMEIRQLVKAVVERYRDEPTVLMWQVENEPYLPVFADEHCGAEHDEEFLKEEIALVRSLDSRPIMLTDGGNFGTWVGAYRNGDVFGTSMYLYFWRSDIGAFRTILPAFYYRIKSNLMRAFGDKPIILSELSLEPWFGAPAHEVSLEEQLSRMSLDKFDEIIHYAEKSRFDTQYLWGVEWWYYMKEKGHPEFWEKARALYDE